MDLSFVASGFAVGLLVGMTGVGGGSLMTPLLTLLFGVSPAVAVGTDLAFALGREFLHVLLGFDGFELGLEDHKSALLVGILAALGRGAGRGRGTCPS